MESPGQKELPVGVTGAGLALACSAALPLTPGGLSFLDIVWRAFAFDPVYGIMTLVGFGSPFLFGIAIALARISSPAPDWSRLVVRVTVALMSGQLVLVSALLARHGRGLHPEGLLGFAVVTTAYLLYYNARNRAEGTGEGPSLRWAVRWGALLVVGVASWLRLQWAGDVRFGAAVEVAGVSAAVLLWLTRPARVLSDSVDEAGRSHRAGDHDSSL